ncbi:MAG: 30S ribosomal protein S17 [Patescibacteria group bacterium]
MRKTLQGTVVADTLDKTITVRVDTSKTHPLYKKSYSTSKKYAVHDEANKAVINDIVIIEECRPVSKRKSWALKEITGREGLKHVEAEPEPVEKTKPEESKAHKKKTAKKTDEAAK